MYTEMITKLTATNSAIAEWYIIYHNKRLQTKVYHIFTTMPSGQPVSKTSAKEKKAKKEQVGSLLPNIASLWV